MANGKKSEIPDMEGSLTDARNEMVVDIPLTELHPFRDHPFKILDDAKMDDTVESIREHGVMIPAIARPQPEGGFELVSGHRRHHACERAGLTTMPVIVRDLDDDAATILMVDSNLQRENILPSERAFAYKMKLDALNRQRGRPRKENVGQVVPLFSGMRSTEIIGEQVGESYKQVQRYIRLTALIPELLDMVDNRIIAFNPAVELSYLKTDEQHMLLEAMDSEQATPSLSQAQRLKKLSQAGRLDQGIMVAIMSEEKKSEQDRVTLSQDVLRKYFPKSYTPKQMEDKIIQLLTAWQKRRQRENER